MGNQIFKMDNVRKTINYLKKNGISHAYYAARERIEEERRADYYYLAPSQEKLTRQRQETGNFPYLFSIVAPAYETEEVHIQEMIASVRAQSYRKWELIIVDASASDRVEKTVREILVQTKDMRIKYRRLPKNLGIAGNTNAGIALAAGEYIALLDHDDFITPDALYCMAIAIQECKVQSCAPVLLYSDEDKYDEASKTFITPHIKQKFNLDLLLSNNYVCHFMVIEANLLKTLKFREEYDGAQDYDLVLRITENLLNRDLFNRMDSMIVHIPKVLYHWRSHARSTALNTQSKSYAYEAGRMALVDFCRHQELAARVEHGLHLGFYETIYEPDILTARKDVGVVGGRILDARGCICAGAYDESGNCLFAGLNGHYSGGSTHRAVLKQDCAAVDVRCMRVREQLQPVFSQILGIPYRERVVRVKTRHGKKDMIIANAAGLNCDEAGYRKLSLVFGRAVCNEGYLTVWDPELTIRQ